MGFLPAVSDGGLPQRSGLRCFELEQLEAQLTAGCQTAYALH